MSSTTVDAHAHEHAHSGGVGQFVHEARASEADLTGRLSYIEPGATVNMKVWRDGKVRTVKLTLGGV